jgi:hypothetical protein
MNRGKTTRKESILKQPVDLNDYAELGPPAARLISLLGLGSHGSAAKTEALPFAHGDTTVGTENELQVAVIGPREEVDLPLTIRDSDYFKNMLKRTATGDAPASVLADLENFLSDNPGRVWENSWVRFPRRTLTAAADSMLEQDLRSDKSAPDSPRRKDHASFIISSGGEDFVRIPISYLLKLALADMVSFGPVPEEVKRFGSAFLGHFLSDNTSPETFSFYPTPGGRHGIGTAAARETAQRFLLCQLLISWANTKFELNSHGQHALVYFAPNAPARQKKLNSLVPDSFYRRLFMSPCLSGWDRGEEKHAYMGLCHRVLSRSQLNTISKLREAGIITSNLVALPNTSNTCLANNGTHVSLGSTRLTRLHRAPGSGFGPVEEKYLGDLSIKITEHFLPLFVGTYSAAPYRMDFQDFHPERALGFLPHELDFTHLRMIWRRWKKKASLNLFGHRMTPFGPEILDRTLSRIFRLKGDFVPDFRLIDYLTTLMSTYQSPALDGTLDNDVRLKQDLADMGVFHTSMSTYQLYKLRRFETMGFSGFEGRYYSQFPSLIRDMAPAVELQNLLSALAYKYMLSGAVTHRDIPDDPTIESERRQIFFGSALGIPTFYVWKRTKNRFLRRILKKTEHIRSSRRYKGYFRVYNREYCKALLRVVQNDGADLVENLGMSCALNELQHRLEHPEARASGRLTAAVLDKTGAGPPLSLRGEEFNTAAENYYRDDLRRAYLTESMEFFLKDCRTVDAFGCLPEKFCHTGLHRLLGGTNIVDYVRSITEDVIHDRLPLNELQKTGHLLLLVIGMHLNNAQHPSHKDHPNASPSAASVHLPDRLPNPDRASVL